MSELIAGTMSSVLLLYPASVHIQSTKAASRTAYHASSAILSRFSPRSPSSAELQLADHSKRIFEDPPAPTCSNSV